MPVSADLGPKLEKYVTKLVKSGRYRSKSEVLREGLRLLQDREKQKVEEFQRLIQAGMDDAEAGRTSPIVDVRKRIMSRVRAAVKRAKTKRAA
jgi:antitoxin ParD1/3/4